jgi:hypothetical protein
MQRQLPTDYVTTLRASVPLPHPVTVRLSRITASATLRPRPAVALLRPRPR